MGVTIGDFIAKQHPSALSLKLLSDLAGLRSGVDGTAKLIASVAAMGDTPTRKEFLWYCMEYIQARLEHDIDICFVFDGSRAGNKDAEHKRRDDKRKKDNELLLKAVEALNQKIHELETSKELLIVVSKKEQEEDNKKEPQEKEPHEKEPQEQEQQPVKEPQEKEQEQQAINDDLIQVVRQQEQEVMDAQITQQKLKKRVFGPTAAMKRELLEMLDLMGIPYIQAKEEADPELADLFHSGIVDYIDATDFDYLMCGCMRLIRKSLRKAKAGEDRVPFDEHQQYHLDDLLKSLKFTYEQFLDFCMLIGCDHVQSDKSVENGWKGVKNIGAKTAYDLIKNCPYPYSLQNVYNSLNKVKYIPCDGFMDKAIAAKKQYTTHEKIDPNTVMHKEVDTDGLSAFLLERGRSPLEIQITIDRLIRNKNKTLTFHNRGMVPLIVAMDRKRVTSSSL